MADLQFSPRRMAGPHVASSPALAVLVCAAIAALVCLGGYCGVASDARYCAAASWFLHKAIGRIQDNVYGLISAPVVPWDLMYWLYIVTFVACGVLAYFLYQKPAGPVRPKQILRFLFPRDIYFHQSAVIDYEIYLLNRIFTPTVVVTRLYSSAWIATAVAGLLVAAFGQREGGTVDGTVGLVAFTLLYSLAADFGDYFSHAMHHRIPLLWQFHRLHHTAEVLTPISVARVHPMEQIVGPLFSTTFSGIFSGFVGYFLLKEPDVFTFFGIQAVTVVFFAAGHNLRHSHVWLPWPRSISHLFISPAQHQIHHSVAPQHRDRNYGYIFAIWDWMFGTLYVPHEREELVFGLGIGEGRLHPTLWAAYTEPFKSAAELIKASLLGRPVERM